MRLYSRETFAISGASRISELKIGFRQVNLHGNIVIHCDTDLHSTQQRVLLFERTLAEARQTYSRSNYEAMAEGYLSEIDKMRAEIRDYLTRIPGHTEAA